MTGPSCDGDVCITCSDQAVRVTVLDLGDDATARVDTGSGVEEVSVALVDAVVGGDLLIHAGEAIAALPHEAQRSCGAGGGELPHEAQRSCGAGGGELPHEAQRSCGAGRGTLSAGPDP